MAASRGELEAPAINLENVIKSYTNEGKAPGSKMKVTILDPATGEVMAAEQEPLPRNYYLEALLSNYNPNGVQCSVRFLAILREVRPPTSPRIDQGEERLRLRKEARMRLGDVYRIVRSEYEREIKAGEESGPSPDYREFW